MKPIRTVAVFPTMLTLANLCCGFFAIVVAARVDTPVSSAVHLSSQFVSSDFDRNDDNHNVMLSGWLIFFAMVFDALDGYVARLARIPTEFGAQLDSLADVVTFGVAPGFLLVKMCPSFAYLHNQAVWMIAATFASCAALRLARFNVESDENDDHLQFNGLPSPAAAGSVAGFAVLFYKLRLESNTSVYAAQVDRVVQTGLPFFGLLVALLMVSRVPYPHVVNQFLRGDRSFGHVVALLVSVAAVTAIPFYAVPIVFAVFVLAPPLWYLWQRIVQRRGEKEPLF
jgi:CDP-diacylglycerol--serine O-phosphatidyltransferase